MIKNLIPFFFAFVFVSCVQQAESVKTASQNNDSVRNDCDLSKVSDSLTDPQTIEELVNLINALPKPLTGECLVKSLKRPLYVNATSSKLSAQPADSWVSPRVFIIKGDLIISVVPTGNGSKLLEFSEMIDSRRSVKGEVILPIEREISQSEPFSHINYNTRTSCSGCHGSERLESTVDGVAVYSSLAFRPFPNDVVSLNNLKDTHYLCQTQLNTSQNCRFMNALFSHGDVIEKAFPEIVSLPQNTFGL